MALEILVIDQKISITYLFDFIFIYWANVDIKLQHYKLPLDLASSSNN